MKILVITEQTLSKEDLIKEYKPFCDQSDIIISKIEDAAKDIQNMTEIGQKHIDLIVCRTPLGKTDISKYTELATSIRDSQNEYSNNNFRLNSIPIVLDSSTNYSERVYENGYRTSILFEKKLSRDSKTFHHGISDVLNDWLRSLEDDLDRLNLDWEFNFSRSKVSLLDRADTRILSESFLRRQKRLNYPWVGDRFLELDVKSSKLWDLLKQSKKSPRLRNEKEYHQYLLNNRGMLLGENYSLFHYEKHFYLPQSRRYVEPDFFNERFNWSLFPNEIFEVKLPNRPYRNFRRNRLTRYARKSIQQVGKKFSDYFSSFENLKEVQKRTGISLSDPTFQFTLLIGREEDQEENDYLIQQELGKYSVSIQILSYDSLISRHERCFERLKTYHLF